MDEELLQASKDALALLDTLLSGTIPKNINSVIDKLRVAVNARQDIVDEAPALERYGPSTDPRFVLQPMPNGYWTPWHIAQRALNVSAYPATAQLLDAANAALSTMSMMLRDGEWYQPELAITRLDAAIAAATERRRNAPKVDREDEPRPIGAEAAVCADIARRQAYGIAKYGTTVANNPLTLRAWLQHGYEECLDQSVYLKRAIDELDKVNQRAQGGTP